MARYDQVTIQAPPVGPDIIDSTFMLSYFQKLVSATISGHYDVNLPQDAAKGLIRAKDDGSGNIQIVLYDGSTEHVIATWTPTLGLRSNLNAPQIIDVTSSTAAVAFDIPSGVKSFRLEYDNFEPVTADAYLILQLGESGSGGAFVTSSSYSQSNISNINGAIDLTNSTGTSFGVSHETDAGTQAYRGWGEILVQGLNQATEVPRVIGSRSAVNSSLQNRFGTFSGRLSSGNFNAFRLLCSSGNIAKLRGRIIWGY